MCLSSVAQVERCVQQKYPLSFFFLASRRWISRVCDDSASSVVILSPPPIPNRTLCTPEEDRRRPRLRSGQVGAGLIFQIATKKRDS